MSVFIKTAPDYQMNRANPNLECWLDITNMGLFGDRSVSEVVYLWKQSTTYHLSRDKSILTYATLNRFILYQRNTQGSPLYMNWPLTITSVRAPMS